MWEMIPLLGIIIVGYALICFIGWLLPDWGSYRHKGACNDEPPGDV